MIAKDQKEQFRKCFRAFLDSKEEIDAINGSMKDLIKTTARMIDVKPKDLVKTLNYLYKKISKGEDEIEAINGVLLQVEEVAKEEVEKNSDDEE